MQYRAHLLTCATVNTPLQVDLWIGKAFVVQLQFYGVLYAYILTGIAATAFLFINNLQHIQVSLRNSLLHLAFLSPYILPSYNSHIQVLDNLIKAKPVCPNPDIFLHPVFQSDREILVEDLVRGQNIQIFKKLLPLGVSSEFYVDLIYPPHF